MREYFEQVCPRCGEKFDVEGGRVESDGNVAWQNVTCNKCGCYYTEVYEYKVTEVWDQED